MNSFCRFVGGKRILALAFMLTLLGAAFSTSSAFAASYSPVHPHNAPIDTSKSYYLVPADQPIRDITYQKYWNQGYRDYLRLAAPGETGTTETPNGTLVKFIPQFTGEYKIQMQSSDYPGYTYLNADHSGVWLDTEDKAMQWRVDPTATGGYLISCGTSLSGYNYSGFLTYDQSNPQWLRAAGVPMGSNPTVWNLVAESSIRI